MSNYSNLDVKFYAKKNHVLEKDVAKELGIGYSSLITLWLRNPLDKAHKAKFKEAVDKIVTERTRESESDDND